MKGIISIIAVLTIIAWIVGFIVFGIHVPAAYPMAAVVLFKTCSVVTILCVLGWSFNS